VRVELPKYEIMKCSLSIIPADPTYPTDHSFIPHIVTCVDVVTVK